MKIEDVVVLEEAVGDMVSGREFYEQQESGIGICRYVSF